MQPILLIGIIASWVFFGLSWLAVILQRVHFKREIAKHTERMGRSETPYVAEMEAE